MPTRITHYDIGDYWAPEATFTVGGTPTDPTTLTVKQQAPDGTETTLASAVSPGSLNASSTPVARVSAGVFKLNPGVQITTEGRWYVKFTGTGNAAASETHEAIGDPDVFTSESGVGSRALVTLQEAKDWLQQQNIDTGEDLELVRVINDISELFQAEAEREFKVVGTNPQTRFVDITVSGGRYGVVDVGDMTSITTVEILDRNWSTVLDTVATADYATLPVNRRAWEPIRQIQLNHANGIVRLRGGYRVRVTGSWGFPSVPGHVRQAVLDEIAAVMDRDVEHYRQDQAPATGGEGANVVVLGSRPQILPLTPRTLAVARSFRDALVA